MSQSSGQVTHVLLTRSRLCPRPKPGSSLHLHVLGTPPAFVLSQDQTLREELLRRAARKRPASQRVVEVRSAGADAPTKHGGGPGPDRWTDQAHASARGTRVHHGSGTHDGVNLAPSSEAPRGESSDGVEPGHTSRPRVRSKSAHAVEFSKTVAPLRKGLPSRGTSETISDSGADR